MLLVIQDMKDMSVRLSCTWRDRGRRNGGIGGGQGEERGRGEREERWRDGGEERGRRGGREGVEERGRRGGGAGEEDRGRDRQRGV